MNYRDFAVELAKEAGALVKAGLLNTAVRTKPDNSPVTDVDIAVNTLVVERIQSAFPDHGIVSEELPPVATNSPYTWVVDPIDGTYPFSLGIPASTISMGLTKDGESILGVILDPFLSRLYVAEKGSGATMNGQTIHVSEAGLEGSVVFLEWWRGNRLPLDSLYGTLSRAGTQVLGLSSVTYVSMLTATGRITGGVFAGDKPWDGAALNVIIEEAGGRVTDLLGNEQRYDQPLNGMVVSNGIIHDELLRHVSRALA